MKKLVLFAVAAMAISFASCTGNGATQNPTTNDSIDTPEVAVEEVQTVIPDSVNGDTTVVTEVAAETVK